MTFREIAVIFILTIWLLANVCYAIFNKKMARITFYSDVFRWISAFQLFSRDIGDHKLYYRDMLPDQSVTGWKYVSLTPHWRIYHAIWFPQKAVPQSIRSIVNDLAIITKMKQDKTNLRKASERFNYNAILCFIMQFPSGQIDVERQFKIEDGKKGELFMSYFHKG